jgi:hypothetical protein
MAPGPCNSCHHPRVPSWKNNLVVLENATFLISTDSVPNCCLLPVLTLFTLQEIKQENPLRLLCGLQAYVDTMVRLRTFNVITK